MTPSDRASVGAWRKKPVVIEAMQIDGTHDRNQQIVDWVNSCNPRWDAADSSTWTISAYYGKVTIRTLEGEMTADKGDWIIKGVKGEFYPCKPDIFAATYEPAGHPAPDPPSDALTLERVREVLMVHLPYRPGSYTGCICGTTNVYCDWLGHVLALLAAPRTVGATKRG